MKLKDGAEITTDDFWYGLFEGYINPKELLADKADVEAVDTAVTVLLNFRKATESITEDM